MKPAALALSCLSLALCAAAVLPAGSVAQPAAADGQPRYDSAGKLLPPAEYRDWAFLSSGVDMSYSDTPLPPGAHSFDNVFAPRAAVETFKRTGVWPDKTVLVLEVRAGATKGSINRQGQFQTDKVQAVELHVKDRARFAATGGWAFYGGDGVKPAAQIPAAAACYSCHEQHAAADTSFVQFYPTLLPAATKLGTLSKAYLANPVPPVGR